MSSAIPSAIDFVNYEFASKLGAGDLLHSSN
jgi:hypothetical protein